MLVLPRARRVGGWRTCWTFSERGRILGYPSYLEPFMAAMANTAESISFGDMSEYLIRIVDVVVERSDEFRFQNNLAAFRCILRLDGALVDVGAVETFVNTTLAAAVWPFRNVRIGHCSMWATPGPAQHHRPASHWIWQPGCGTPDTRRRGSGITRGACVGEGSDCGGRSRFTPRRRKGFRLSCWTGEPPDRGASPQAGAALRPCRRHHAMTR